MKLRSLFYLARKALLLLTSLIIFKQVSVKRIFLLVCRICFCVMKDKQLIYEHINRGRQHMNESMIINGKEHEIDVDGDMPLLWFLRDRLEFTGTKFGCGSGLCGACTVHVNGQAMRSCVTPVSSLAGQKITTIEGLSENGDHPLQKAWLNNNVPQCGYCQAGQIMNAASLLAVNAAPTDEEIDTAMQGNICRCGTYQRIKKAISEAADTLSREA